MSTCLPHHLKRECICETMNPGPLLIIRNTFPITFIALLFSEIIKTENTKTLYLLHSSSKTPKIYSIQLLSLLPPSLHTLFITIAYLLTVLHLLFILISFSHLVLDNHLVRLRAQNKLFVCRKSREGQEDKSSLLIPREFDIKPSSHPSWGKHVFHLLHTLHLESQPNPFTFHAGNYVKGHQDCFLAPLPGNHC